ncbi:YicC/YloC family endoribonuclease [Virgibacillus ndiopensis]|uniref:YicC/YloC family endoribonuclease n=1 Tax=Virgibacillus ndiopensis TaxID=2004408 RepID=UPI000C07D0F6|nr:YicC/YloC family endoribonuclease [Virgibacillus ndiopensis]
MVKSMTGFGRDVVHIGETTITVEIRSVNHRYLDFNTKFPSAFLFLEDRIKRVVQSYFKRGRIEIYIGIEGDGFVKRSLHTDWDLMDQYMEQIKRAKERYNLSGEIPTSIITTMPDLFSIQREEQQVDRQTESILTSIEKACSKVSEMRENEGKHLLHDILNRMETIRNTITLLHTRRESVINEYRDRIFWRINEHLDGRASIDDARMLQEIALLAEKGDITEEITRLFSHIDHFLQTTENQDAIGRKLDFILQEMHRETNTIGSKSTDPKIGEWVVSLKSDVEKIKEQIQNIE